MDATTIDRPAVESEDTDLDARPTEPPGGRFEMFGRLNGWGDVDDDESVRPESGKTNLLSCSRSAAFLYAAVGYLA